MTNKKNRFFTLVFSCCPGAGEMIHGAVSAGGQPDGSVFWYDCLSGMVGL